MQSKQTKKTISKKQKRKQGKDANWSTQMKMKEQQKDMILYSRPIEEVKAERIHHAFVRSGKQNISRMSFYGSSFTCFIFVGFLSLLSMIAYLYDNRTFDKVSDAEFISLLESSKPRTLEIGLPIPDDERFIYNTLETRSQHRRPNTFVSNNYYLASWHGFHYLVYSDADMDSNHLALHLKRDNTYPGEWHRFSSEGRVALKTAQAKFPDLQIVSSGMFSIKEKSSIQLIFYMLTGFSFVFFLKILKDALDVRAAYRENYEQDN